MSKPLAKCLRVVWTIRNRAGNIKVMVRWLNTGDLEVWGNVDGVTEIPAREARKTIRLMQRALDFRYGKRRKKRKPKEINVGAWIDQDT